MIKPTERLLSNKEAAELLGMEPRQLERLRGANRGPIHTYVGRYPRYSRKHIIEYLAARGVITNDAK